MATIGTAYTDPHQDPLLNFFSSWSRKLIRLLVKSGNARVITVDEKKGLGDFTMV